MITSAAQACMGNYLWHTGLLQAHAAIAPSDPTISVCTPALPDAVGVDISVFDGDGSRTHTMAYLAVKVEFATSSTEKIGTIVITDLRLIDVPGTVYVVHTMPIADLIFRAHKSNWTVSNAMGFNYICKEETTYVCILDGKIVIKA